MPYEVIRILRVAKGHGLVVGQANFDDDALTEAKALLEDGEAPAAVLQAITDPAVFPNAPWMQYGIVDIEGQTVSTTGPNAKPFADDLDGTSGSVPFTVQGNFLTGPDVLAQMAAAMDEGCDLPERLVRALEAAGDGGAGDSRCVEDGLSAASAYVYVAWKDGAELRVSLPDVRPANPVVVLREALEEWRVDHGCPGPGGENEPASGDGPDTENPSGCAVSRMPRVGLEGGGWGGLLILVAALGLAAGRTRRTRAGSAKRSADRHAPEPTSYRTWPSPVLGPSPAAPRSP